MNKNSLRNKSLTTTCTNVLIFSYFDLIQGLEEGTLYVSVTPCNQNGKALDEDYFVDDPSELLRKPYHFKVSFSLKE